jgi:hypothetical protein
MHDMPARESVPELFSPLSNVMGIFRELSCLFSALKNKCLVAANRLIEPDL